MVYDFTNETVILFAFVPRKWGTYETANFPLLIYLCYESCGVNKISYKHVNILQQSVRQFGDDRAFNNKSNKLQLVIVPL